MRLSRGIASFISALFLAPPGSPTAPREPDGLSAVPEYPPAVNRPGQAVPLKPGQPSGKGADGEPERAAVNCAARGSRQFRSPGSRRDPAAGLSRDQGKPKASTGTGLLAGLRDIRRWFPSARLRRQPTNFRCWRTELRARRTPPYEGFGGSWPRSANQ
jgi:hypothetical protein